MTHVAHDFDHILTPPRLGESVTRPAHISDLTWIREPPGDYHLDDPDPGYDDIMRRPPLGPLAVLWGEGNLAYVLEDGEVVERNDGS